MPGPRLDNLGKGNNSASNVVLQPVTTTEELQEMITDSIVDGAKIYVASERKDYYYDKATDTWVLSPEYVFDQDNKNKVVDVYEDELNSLDKEGVAAWLNAKNPAVDVQMFDTLYLRTRLSVAGFTTEWTTQAADEQIVLPLDTSTFGAETLTVNWGDGTTDTIAAGEEAKLTHTYSDAGAHQVSCKGFLNNWRMDQFGLASTSKLTSVISWGDATFSNIRFKGASNLTSLPMNESPVFTSTSLESFMEGTGITEIPPMLFKNAKPGTYTIRFIFNNCSGITSIPAGLFDQNFESLRYAKFVFSGCSIAQIPAGLFDYCPIVEELYSAFDNNNLTAIPAGLFDNTTALTTLAWAFGQNQITAIPAGLFDNLTNLTTLYWCFYNNELSTIPNNLLVNNVALDNVAGMFLQNNLTAIPAGLFDTNINVTDVMQTFQNNLTIPEIPVGLLDNMPGLTRVWNTFGGNNITTIPAGLFDNNPDITRFDGCFTSNPITSIPAGLFDNNVNAVSFSSCFSNVNITAIPAGLFDLNVLAEDFGTVFQNAPITAIPEALFDNNTAANDFHYAFFGCTQVTGAVPELWVKFPGILPAASDNCFTGANNATNYNAIPADWK